MSLKVRILDETSNVEYSKTKKDVYDLNISDHLNL